jgi:hypothetical protein
MIKMNEKNTANMFEKAYVSIGKDRPEASNLTNIESEIGEIPLPVKELLNEVMKAKHNSDMDKLTQEIKESKIQHDLVEELRKEIRDLHAKIGNVEQEKILLHSLTSKIRDIDTNVMIYQKTVDQITQEIKDSKAQPDLVKEYFIQKGIKILQENLGELEQIPPLEHLR